jgi:cell division protein FtsW
MVFSTTAFSSTDSGTTILGFFNRHLVSLVLGFFLAFIAYKIDPNTYRKAVIPLLIISVGSLLLVLLTGRSAGGAMRWIQIGSLRVQPGEFVKLVTVITVACYIDRFKEKLGNFLFGVMIPITVLSFFAVLFLLQPDFGSTAVVFLVAGAQLFLVAGLSHFMSIGLLAIVAGGFLVAMSPYRMRRFLAFLDPFSDPSSSGYQLIQSLIAVGSGGVWGEGLGVGRQKLFYLPAAHTDFIFAVISEEFGLIGAVFVLSLFLLILVRGFKIAFRLSGDLYLSSLAFGLTVLIVLPALLNMSVVLGMLPTKGLVLPFISYGGTAMLVSCISIGMLLRLSTQEVIEN